MRLQDYPHPPQDNGIGMHLSGGHPPSSAKGAAQPLDSGTAAAGCEMGQVPARWWPGIRPAVAGCRYHAGGARLPSATQLARPREEHAESQRNGVSERLREHGRQVLLRYQPPSRHPYDAVNQQGKEIARAEYDRLGVAAWQGQNWRLRSREFVSEAKRHPDSSPSPVLSGQDF